MRKTMLSGIILFSSLFIGLANASNAKQVFDWTATLQGDWKLAPAEMQVGGATKKGPAAKLLGTDKTAMSFGTTGKGSAIVETLLPGTPKEMVTMYHCYDKTCSWVKATHYCAKKNQPEFKAAVEESSKNKLAFNCDMGTDLCKSDDGHVHKIEHEMLDSGVLKTTYTIWQDSMEQKKSIYHFVRK